MPVGLAGSVAVSLGCLGLCLLTWPMRRHASRRRRIELIPIGIAAALLPILQPHTALWLRVVVCLACPVMATKLIDLQVGAEYWNKRGLMDWLAYLVFPYILVPRVSIQRSKPATTQGLTKLARAIVQMSAGAVLLWFSFQLDWARYPFVLEYTTKLAAAYLLALDGMFLLIEGILLLTGISVLPLSREPIAACTPADFWRRYNCEAGRFLREDVFRLVGGVRHTTRGILAAFAFNAVLHEYLSWLMTGRILGLQLTFFGLNGLAVAATYRMRPAGVQKWVARSGTLLFMWATAILFFATVNQFYPWYAVREGR